ncbi:hypothetical protein GCM10009022_23680 [Vreelandella titanicae]|jgi:hypothetical protein
MKRAPIYLLGVWFRDVMAQIITKFLELSLPLLKYKPNQRFALERPQYQGTVIDP